MAYIGNTPAEKFSAFSKQDFTTSATTSYTLDNPVSNANEIALFINHVRQEPTTAYTAAGTALTLTSATAATDDMYCVYLGKAVQTVNPANGSVDTAQLADSAVTNAKIEDGTIATSKLGAGALLQLQSTTFGTATTSSSSTYADITGASLSITPSSTSSKIYFTCFLSGLRKSSSNTFMGLKLFRQINSGGYSEIKKFENGFGYTNSSVTVSSAGSYALLDSPATTDQVDYKLQFNSGNNTDGVKVNVDGQEASTITLMEIGG
jgi:hypothetical protein